MKLKLSVACTVVLMCGAFGTPARADSMHGLGRKDRSCVANCIPAWKVCRDAAQAQRQLCAAATCSAEIATAHQACADNDASAACQAAEEALATCLQPCGVAFDAATSVCRDDAKQCMGGCPTGQPPPNPASKDPACVRGCARTLAGCAGDARDAAQACRDQCGTLVDAARTVCAADRKSADCQAARQAVSQCVALCNDTLRSATGTCLDSADSCVNACPVASPSPTPVASPTPGHGHGGGDMHGGRGAGRQHP